MTQIDDPMSRLENMVIRQDMEERADRAIKKARIRLVLDGSRTARGAFFACLALKLNTEADWKYETAATDGKDLKYNPEWFLGLSEEQRVGVVAHEVLHLAMKHHVRRGHRDFKLWNLASDLAVNPLLAEADFKLPSCASYPGRGQYRHLPVGLSAEEYYLRLQEPQDQGNQDQEGQGQGEGDGQGDGQGQSPGQAPPDPGGCGGVEDPGTGSPAECKESEAKWDQNVAEAHQAAKARGNLSGGLDRLVQQVLQPKVDWKEVLREFVSRMARNDFSWSHPNRRFIHQGIYLPGLRSEELGEVMIAVDTSGSIGAVELAVFAGEIQGILAAFDCQVTIIYHDSDVAHIQKWSSTDGPLVLEPKGGGGTDHNPVFEWIARQEEQPTCLVCLTDMYSSFPKMAPDYPVLWASTTEGKKGPWGQTLEVDL